MVLTKCDVNWIVKMLLINNQKSVQGYVIASLYFKIGEYRKALKYVARYLKLCPDSPLAYKLQGECYEKLNRANDALNSYQKVIDSAEKKRRNVKLQAVSSTFEEIKQKLSRDTSSMLKSSVPTTISEETDTVTTNQMEAEMHSPCAVTTFSDVAVFRTESDLDEPCSETTFKFTVDHISTLDCVVCSPLFAFQNLSWRLNVRPKRDLGANRALSFYLQCNEDDDSTLWSCNVEAEFRLLSVEPNQYPYVQRLRHLFNNDEKIWGFPRFISWNDVVSPENNYMRNDCITVEVHVEVLD